MRLAGGAVAPRRGRGRARRRSFIPPAGAAQGGRCTGGPGAAEPRTEPRPHEPQPPRGRPGARGLDGRGAPWAGVSPPAAVVVAAAAGAMRAAGCRGSR